MGLLLNKHEISRKLGIISVSNRVRSVVNLGLICKAACRKSWSRCLSGHAPCRDEITFRMFHKELSLPE